MSNNAYSGLMKQSLQAHKAFRGACDEIGLGGAENKESAAVTKAREEFLHANNELWSKLLYPLQNKFNIDRSSAIDEVMDFLEVDIPAFRCGYLKEYFLEHLKSVDLTDIQKKRLSDVALRLCESDTVRREFRRWVNLMRPLADGEFVLQLHKVISANHQNRAAKLMLDGVLKNRLRLGN